MIGYAPFLGQVRLVHLGQSVQDESNKVAARISRLRGAIQTADVRPGVRQALVDKINTCERSLPNNAGAVTDFEATNKCLDELEYVLASPLLPMLVTREETEKRVFGTDEKPGVPTWAYVGSILAIIGGGAAAVWGLKKMRQQ